MNILLQLPWHIQGDYSKYRSAVRWVFHNWSGGSKVEVMARKRNWIRKITEEKMLKFFVPEAIKSIGMMKRYDLIISDGAQISILFAFLRSLLGVSRPPHVILDVGCFNGARRNRLELSLIRQAVKSVAGVIYHARIQEDYYKACLPELWPKCRFVPLGIDPRYFKSIGLRAQNYIFTFGYGGLDSRDWPTLFGAFDRLDNKVELVVIGKSSFSKKELNGLPLPAGVRTMPFSPFETLKKHIESSRFVVLPLPYHPHSHGQMSLLESMALGKAVIVAKAPGVIDYVEDGGNALLYELGNPVDLKEKIEFLLNNPGEIERLGANARSSIESRFNENNMARNICFAIKDLCGIEE
jgi:glycosyltransferase involved in cell wall biosynthesis